MKIFHCLILIIIATGIFLPCGYSIHTTTNNFYNLSWLSEYANIHDNVQLHLYKNKQNNVPDLINSKNIHNTAIHVNRPTKILIHGKSSNAHDNDLIVLKNEIFKLEQTHDFNIIIVDYAKYAYLDYPKACSKIRYVGSYIAKVLLYLFYNNKIILEDIHIVGRGLGAHLAGFIGKTVKANSDRKIGHITGLDPVASLFERPIFVSENDRLDKLDAHFTDIIHTSIGGIGFKTPIGHADFYPNGGYGSQPGCIQEIFPYPCSHSMAVIYYVQSVNMYKFNSVPCESWSDFITQKCVKSKYSKRLIRNARMGYHVDKFGTSGNYYLSTL